jgi:uncharacterized MAPEG superfamily protein
MTTELMVLAWACVLGIVQPIIAAEFEKRQYGTEWSFSSRDQPMPPWSPLVTRLKRAQANFLENFPVFIGAVLVVQLAGLSSAWTAAGALLWLAARIVYFAVYGIGIPYLRSGIYLVSLAGIALLLWPALF